MDKIKTVKIRNEDGSVSEESYIIATDAKNVDMNNGKDLQATIGNIDIDTDGSIAEQLKKYKSYDGDIREINDNISSLEGTLEKKIYYFNTVANMKAASFLKNGDCVRTLGYYSANDGGGAEYKIVNTTSDNYVETLNTNLFAELIIKDEINVKQFGAYGDGTHDDTNILNTIFSNYVNNGQTILIPAGTYLCSSRITINNLSNVTFNCDGAFLSEYGILLSGLVRCLINNIKVNRTYTRYDYTSLANKGIEFLNCKYLTINRCYVSGFEYGYYWHSLNGSNSYHEIYALHSFDNLHGWYTINEGTGFTNEVKVFGGRFSLNTNGVDVAGIADYIYIPTQTSMHCFVGVCLEGELTKINCAGSYNSFINCRLEYQSSNNQDVIFSGNSNTLFGCYMSEQSGGTKIVNTGSYNKIDESRRFDIDKIIPLNPIVIVEDYSLSKTYNYILCDCSDNNIEIELPLNNRNHIHSIIRIKKIDPSDNYVSLKTTNQSTYDYIGRGPLLKNLNDYIDMYWDGDKWTPVTYNQLYESALTTVAETNLIEGLNYKNGNNNMIVAEGGTISGTQITNTYCDTTADSAEITISINGSSNRTLRVGNYITIDNENGVFKIIKIDLTTNKAILNRVVTQTLTNVRIKYKYPVKKYIGLIYDKVDDLPSTAGNIGDLVFYNTPTSGGYIGAVYTAAGWKNFGSIE